MSGLGVSGFEDQAVTMLLDVSIKMTVLAFVVWAVINVLRIRSATVRHRLWTLVLAGMILMPILTLMAPDVTVPHWQILTPLSVQNPGVANSASPAPSDRHLIEVSLTQQLRHRSKPLRLTESNTSASEVTKKANHNVQTTLIQPDVASSREQPMSFERTPHDRISQNTIVLAVYFVGAALMLFRILFGLLKCRALMRRTRLVHLPQRLAAPVTVASIVESDEIVVPITLGVWRPMIVLPTDWTTWDNALIEIAISHEAEHVRRRDTWVIVLTAFNTAIYWFHPLSWIVRRHITDLAEQVCDDEVVRSTGRRTDYAQFLVEMSARLTRGVRRYQPSGIAMARTPFVEQRVCRIIDSSQPLSTRLSTFRSGMLFCFLSAFVVVTAGLSPAATKATDNESEAPVADTNFDSAASSGSFRIAGQLLEESTSPIPIAEGPTVFVPKPRRARPNNSNGLVVLAGNVSNSLGAPISGARIWLRMVRPNDKELETSTDSNGMYSFQIELSREMNGFAAGMMSSIWCYSKGCKIATSSSFEQLTRHSLKTINFKLESGTDTFFVVTDPAGIPVVNASVEPGAFSNGGATMVVPTQLKQLISRRTDKNGQVLIPEIGMKGYHHLKVTAKEHGVQRIQLTDLDKEPGPRSISLRQTGRIEGQLLAQDAAVFRNVQVIVSQDAIQHSVVEELGYATGWAQVSVDAKGRFVVPHIAEGPSSIRLTGIDKSIPLRPRIPRSLKVRPNVVSKVEIPFERTVRVRGRLGTKELDDQTSLAGASIWIRPDGSRQPEIVVTDKNGRYTADVLPGRVSQQLLALLGSGRRNWPAYDVTPQTVNVPEAVDGFELPSIEPAARSGRVLDHEARPVAGAEIMAVADNRTLAATVTEEDGAFSLQMGHDVKAEKYIIIRKHQLFPMHGSVTRESPLIIQLPK